MSQQADFYRLLGVSRDAPDREIKKAYYALARQLHPDKAATPDEARTNSDRLAQISQAYNTLKDPKKREEYDRSSAGKATSGGPSLTPQPTMPRAAAPAAAPAPAAGDGKTAPPAGGSAPPPAAAAARNSNEMAQQRIAMAQKAFVRGMQHFKAFEYDKARPFFEAAIQNDPDSEPHYHNKYAQCLIRSRGSFTKAVEAAQKAAEMDNYNLEFKLTLGEIYEAAGVPTKAIEVYEDVLRWDADNGRAKQRLADMKAKDPKNQPLLAKLLPSLFGKKK